MIALNYGGVWDIVNALKKISEKGETINAKNFLKFTELKGEEVEIFIRTGGEKRVSNFLLPNIGYSELSFLINYGLISIPKTLMLFLMILKTTKKVWQMKKISIFGFTGNLGTQALDILKSYKNQFEFDIFVCDKNLNLAKSVVKENLIQNLFSLARKSKKSLKISN